MENTAVNTAKVQALATFLECDVAEITQGYNENNFEYGSKEYLVCTDEEADDLWEESLDNYLEECIYPELSGNLSNYFDEESWKRDARYDGRGHSLSSYDGNEEEVDGFYIYRIN